MKAVELTKVIQATPERVFRAWTSAEELRLWHCPADFKVGSAECDPRVGGTYRISMIAPDGTMHVVSGTYLELTQPSQLRMTWAWELNGDPADGSILTITLAENSGGGTTLVLRHDGIGAAESVQSHTAGWAGALENLANIFQSTTGQ